MRFKITNSPLFLTASACRELTKEISRGEWSRSSTRLRPTLAGNRMRLVSPFLGVRTCLGVRT